MKQQRWRPWLCSMLNTPNHMSVFSGLADPASMLMDLVRLSAAASDDGGPWMGSSGLSTGFLFFVFLFD
jgi:hypothetical protein